MTTKADLYQCEICKYLMIISSVDFKQHRFECRRRAPEVGPMGATWPALKDPKQDWCGECIPVDHKEEG